LNLFFCPEITHPRTILSGPEAHHLLNVLRHTTGDLIRLTNGNGEHFTCRIAAIGKGTCELIIHETILVPRNPSGLHIAIGILKASDRMEWMTEKLTECGITSLSLFHAANSERKTVNTERLSRSAISALKQSGRAWLPELTGPLRFQDILKSTVPNRFIASTRHKEALPLLKAAAGKTENLILIGPEGDFTEEEVRMATEAGFQPVSLGESTLRSETAALYACIVLNQSALTA